MQADYQIEDIVFQTRELVVYRAFHKDGTPHAVVRFKFSDEILENLQKQDRFQNALDELILLRHSSLRPVVDGGLDSIDGQAWLAALWWEGSLLSDSEITQDLIDRLRVQAEDLISALGYRSGALCFTPSEIVTTTASDGQTVHTFAIDYHHWFRDWATGYPPGERNDPHQALDQLIKSLTPLQPSPAAKPATILATPKTPAHPIANPERTPASVPSAPLSLPIPKSSPLKPLALIGALLLLISGGIWFINKKPAVTTPSDAPDAQTKPTPEKPKKPSTSPPKITPTTTASTPKPAKPKPSPEPKPVPEITAAPRPEFAGEIYDVEASKKSEINENIGKWIVLNGEISEVSDDTLSFKDSALQAKLPDDAPAITTGQIVNITGLLKSATLLEIERPDDIIVNQPIKEIYTLDDEEQLRGMSRAIVSVQATVTDFTKTKSGSSLYLVFHEEGPGFRAAVSAKKAEEGLDEEYLRSFVGKEIIVTGEVSVFENASGGRGKRLVIRFSKKAEIKLVK
ncbi:MAG: hypothetical protein QNL33_04845 [Akkermansiaceae bacterium]